MRLVALDTIVEQAGSVGERDEELGYDVHTGHPVSLAIRKAVAEPVFDTKHNKGGDVNQVYGAVRHSYRGF